MCMDSDGFVKTVTKLLNVSDTEIEKAAEVKYPILKISVEKGNELHNHRNEVFKLRTAYISGAKDLRDGGIKKIVKYDND